jgi:hypothetical protein
MSYFRSQIIRFLPSISFMFEDFCLAAMSRLSLICWAYNNDPNTSNQRGNIGRWIYYHRLGQPLVRSRPASFRIKDKSVWKGRWSKFQTYMQCARGMKQNLSSLYEGAQIRRTWWSVLCSQLSGFWLKQNNGTYLFSPGVALISIGNGSLPDARNVVFASPSTNKLKISFDTSIQLPGVENNDDTLQLMFIDENGEQSFWLDLTSVTRSSGSATYIIPEQFETKIYPSVKFKSGAQHAGMLKGTFRFPLGMQPVTIIR